MAGLPPGWAWDYDGSRWFYQYKPTGHIQFHFPKEGDEFPEHFDVTSPAPALAPEEKLESQQQVKRRASAARQGDCHRASGMSANARPVSNFLADDGGSHFSVFQPEALMYLGPASYLDVSPMMEEEEEEAAKRVVAGVEPSHMDPAIPQQGLSGHHPRTSPHEEADQRRPPFDASRQVHMLDSVEPIYMLDSTELVHMLDSKEMPVELPAEEPLQANGSATPSVVKAVHTFEQRDGRRLDPAPAQTENLAELDGSTSAKVPNQEEALSSVPQAHSVDVESDMTVDHADALTSGETVEKGTTDSTGAMPAPLFAGSSSLLAGAQLEAKATRSDDPQPQPTFKIKRKPTNPSRKYTPFVPGPSANQQLHHTRSASVDTPLKRDPSFTSTRSGVDAESATRGKDIFSAPSVLKPAGGTGHHQTQSKAPGELVKPVADPESALTAKATGTIATGLTKFPSVLKPARGRIPLEQTGNERPPSMPATTRPKKEYEIHFENRSPVASLPLGPPYKQDHLPQHDHTSSPGSIYQAPEGGSTAPFHDPQVLGSSSKENRPFNAPAYDISPVLSRSGSVSSSTPKKSPSPVELVRRGSSAASLARSSDHKTAFTPSPESLTPPSAPPSAGPFQFRTSSLRQSSSENLEQQSAWNQGTQQGESYFPPQNTAQVKRHSLPALPPSSHHIQSPDEPESHARVPKQDVSPTPYILSPGGHTLHRIDERDESESEPRRPLAEALQHRHSLHIDRLDSPTTSSVAESDVSAEIMEVQRAVTGMVVSVPPPSNVVRIRDTGGKTIYQATGPDTPQGAHVHEQAPAGAHGINTHVPQNQPAQPYAVHSRQMQQIHPPSVPQDIASSSASIPAQYTQTGGSVSRSGYSLLTKTSTSRDPQVRWDQRPPAQQPAQYPAPPNAQPTAPAAGQVQWSSELGGWVQVAAPKPAPASSGYRHSVNVTMPPGVAHSGAVMHRGLGPSTFSDQGSQSRPNVGQRRNYHG